VLRSLVPSRATVLLNKVEKLRGKTITEEVFADFMAKEYADVDDEHYFNWLDYCDSATYDARVRRLRTLFWKLDSDGSGVIDMDEKRQYAKKLGSKLGVPVTDEWINQTVCDFAFIDSNCDGKISEEEFITGFLEIFEMWRTKISSMPWGCLMCAVTLIVQ